ncbi:hypothetical protein EJD97_014079, partial [Solanum chilense]
TRLGRRTTRRTVVVTTDRRGLRHPILGAFSSAAFFIPLDGKCDGPSQARRSVEGLRFKILQLLESGYWDHFSDLHDGPAGRTVMDMTVRHKLRNPTLGQISPSSFSSCTTLSPTDRHRH